MKSEPPRQIELAPETKLRAVVKQLPADLETPVSAFLKLQPHGAFFLLESVEQGENIGRFSFIGLSCARRMRLHEEHALAFTGDEQQTIPLEGANPVEPLRKLVKGFQVQPHPLLPRLLGGAVGFLGYEWIHSLEKIPVPPERPDYELPVGEFYLADHLVVFDHVQRIMMLVALAGEPEAGFPTESRARQDLDRTIDLLRSSLPPLAPPRCGSAPPSIFQAQLSRDQFCSSVEKARQYIADGECYQVVLSQRLEASLRTEPFPIYRALRMLNPSPYMFYLDFKDYQLIGSSPEVLVKQQDGLATIRPIAGTRPRGVNEDEDRYLEEELLADEKERAEHVMLVDLARNELGRCCDYGSVRVTELLAVERYSHVMHIVSNVAGRLRKELDSFDLLRQCFPAGTVSGAPKIRAMELITELEQTTRGPYAGAVGYFGLGGELDTCIAIRMMLVCGGRAYLQAGAGIAGDSKPDREYVETLNKLEALKAAVLTAEHGL